jgi:hypothetical protein
MGDLAGGVSRLRRPRSATGRGPPVGTSDLGRLVFRRPCHDRALELDHLATMLGDCPTIDNG